MRDFRTIYLTMSSACWKPFELNSLLWDMGKALSSPHILRKR